MSDNQNGGTECLYLKIINIIACLVTGHQGSYPLRTMSMTFTESDFLTSIAMRLYVCANCFSKINKYPTDNDYSLTKGSST